VQARELARLGCTHAQGYLFSRPLSTKAAEQLIIANEPLGPKRVPQADAGDAGDRWSDLLVAAVPAARTRDTRTGSSVS
jgi:hypothetical protein